MSCQKKDWRGPSFGMTTFSYDTTRLCLIQAQQLVQMICYPGGVPEMPEEDEDDEDQEPVQKQIITRILKVN